MSLAYMGDMAAGLLVRGQTHAGCVETRHVFERRSGRNFLPNNEDEFTGISGLARLDLYMDSTFSMTRTDFHRLESWSTWGTPEKWI